MKKKRFKNYLKRTAIIVGVLLTMTNCEQEEIQYEQEEIQIVTENNQLFTIPEIATARKSFEISNNSTNIFNKTSSGSKEAKKKFFIAWDNSRVVKFNKKKGIDILYTPIVYDKKGKRNKTFIASATNKKNKTESYIYSLFYDHNSTAEYFSGVIAKFDTKGSLTELLEYDKGLRSKKYSLKKENSSKVNYSAKSSDECNLTLYDIITLLDLMMEAGGGVDINMLECVWLGKVPSVSYTKIDMERLLAELNSSSSWDDVPIFVAMDYPDIFYEGGGGPRPTVTPVEPTPEPVDEKLWWTEEEEEAVLLTHTLNLFLDPAKFDWANDPINFEWVKLLNLFLDNNPTEEAEDFANLAIDIVIDSSNSLTFSEVIVVVENSIDYRMLMSESEIDVFDSLSPLEQYRYLRSAQAARNKTQELYPTMCERLGGLGDAFRHAYWSALATLSLGEYTAEILLTKHEEREAYSPYAHKENEMDLFNNEIGKNIAIKKGDINLVQNILNALNDGSLRYLTNRDSECLATFSSQLIPTNQ